MKRGRIGWYLAAALVLGLAALVARAWLPIDESRSSVLTLVGAAH